MIVKPKVRGFICTTAHPVGCEAQVQQQIDYVSGQGQLSGPKKVLVIGASTGYGLASRIVASFACGADTIGVFFEKPAAGKRTASAGWYNSAAFEDLATAAGCFAASVNGDAFSNEIKQQTIELIKETVGQVDLVIYSLASPRRVHPETGEVYNSVLKTVGAPYTQQSLDPLRGELNEVTIEPATEQEIADTIAVMGGEDWTLWMEQLLAAKVLAPGALTLAYSYIGPELTYPMYRHGTIGKAKDDLEQTAQQLNKTLASIQGRAYVSVNKAVVTQASAAIPVVPLYISALFKVMKEKGLHEGCIEQAYRLFKDFVYNGGEIPTDEQQRIRLDDWEMRDDVQQAVAELWHKIDATSLNEITDLAGYCQDFYHLFGFAVDGLDYDEDIDVDRPVPSVTVKESA